jgi:hypothetical protein
MWWDSLEQVELLARLARGAVVACGALTAIIAVLDWQLGNRVEVLRAVRHAPRQLSEAQRAQFLSAVGTNAKSGPVSIAAAANDPEAWAFAHGLQRLLTDAGWIVNPVQPKVFAADPVGMYLVVDDPQTPSSDEDLIVRELRRLGFAVAVQEDERQNTPLLVIGVKPR